MWDVLMSAELIEKHLQEEKDYFIINSKITHKNQYDYSCVKFLGWMVKCDIVCKKHGVFKQSPSDHFYFQEICPNCEKDLINENKWLNSLNIPNNKKYRNVYLSINKKKRLILAADIDKKIIYEYLYDDYSGNLNLYSPNDIHPELKLKYSDLFEITKKRHEQIKNNGYEVVYIWHSEFIKNKDKIIICDNKFCQYISNSPTTLHLLRELLSYKVSGVEYTPAYQNGWNGINYLIDKRGKFNYGLIEKVKKFLTDNEISFSVEDKRNPKINAQELDISDNCKKYNLIPREHQIKMVNEALLHDRGIIKASTGSGKTLAIALIVSKINKPTIIYVIGLDLLDQFHDLFSKLFNEPIGYIGNGICNIQRINIASIWSIGSALKLKDIVDDDCEKEKEINDNDFYKIIELLNNAKLHVYDEGHIVSTNTVAEIYKNINPEYIYGFSGTPFRDDNTDLLVNSILGEQIVNVSASELINLNLLAQPIIKFTPVPKMRLTGNSTYASVYKEYIVENDIRNNLIIKEAKNLLDKKYVPLVLFKQIKHGEILYEKFKEAGINCLLLNGNDPLEKRNDIKNKIANKEVDLLLSSVIFDIGLDLPILSGLILAGGGRSSIRALQRIGRVIRKYPGKKYAAVVDFYDQVKFLKQHSLRRCEIYESETGFIVKKCKEML